MREATGSLSLEMLRPPSCMRRSRRIAGSFFDPRPRSQPGCGGRRRRSMALVKRRGSSKSTLRPRSRSTDGEGSRLSP
eukprot:5628975-Heterocapsa_arctica.AAC.1